MTGATMAERAGANQRDAKLTQYHSFEAQNTAGEAAARPTEAIRRHVVPDVLFRLDPVPEAGRDAAESLPLVFDSPHSGAVYTADFGHAAPLEILRRRSAERRGGEELGVKGRIR